MRAAGLLSLVLTAALLGGCSSPAGDTEDAAAPATTDSTAATPTHRHRGPAGQVTLEAAPAALVVEQLYDALGLRDCYTMRTLATPSLQQDDDYWADGCIDELQLTVGDDYSYSLLDGSVDGREAVFHVQRPLPDGTQLTEEVVLIAVAGGWMVESRTQG